MICERKLSNAFLKAELAVTHNESARPPKTILFQLVIMSLQFLGSLSAPSPSLLIQTHACIMKLSPQQLRSQICPLSPRTSFCLLSLVIRSLTLVVQHQGAAALSVPKFFFFLYTNHILLQEYFQCHQIFIEGLKKQKSLQSGPDKALYRINLFFPSSSFDLCILNTFSFPLTLSSLEAV